MFLFIIFKYMNKDIKHIFSSFIHTYIYFIQRNESMCLMKCTSL